MSETAPPSNWPTATKRWSSQGKKRHGSTRRRPDSGVQVSSSILLTFRTQSSLTPTPKSYRSLQGIAPSIRARRFSIRSTISWASRGTLPAVAIKMPCLARFDSKAPRKSRTSRMGTARPGSYRFAWMYTRSRPSGSTGTTPSTPPSQNDQGGRHHRASRSPGSRPIGSRSVPTAPESPRGFGRGGPSHMPAM